MEIHFSKTLIIREILMSIIKSILFRACPKTQKILRDNSLEIFNKM
ncbi:SLEI domain protein, PF07620 family [Leptospira noguchii str. 2006001870]|uniref:SLEI domain protein, PF07620 family n=1 Tax=Leptospira noguchii str. 2001034031 TaxID=1193053 RepID=M6YHF5_9LEPT|nr:SLEI domain protein, PF07620 family [Leptospira noguchii str. 2006001870]EMO89019.1 SLEI domain protein, PF07620 family [Leptospira noguchii str. 2001034031]